MFIPEGRALLLAMLAGCTLLSACGESPPDPGAKPAAVARPKAPKTATLDEKMVAAVSSSTSAAAIGVHFSLTTAPSVNQGLPVDIAIVPHQVFTSVAVHFFGQDGLTLISGDTFGPVNDPASEKTLKHQLVVMPAREGLYMISASVETIGIDGSVSRMFSIPVVVAPAAAVETAPEPVAPAPSAPPPPASN